MIPLIKERTYKKPLIAQLDPTFIARDYLPPASTSCQSNQDTSGRWVSQHTNLPGTFHLASASAPVIDPIPLTRSTSLQNSSVPDCGFFVDSDNKHDIEEKSEAPERFISVAYSVLYASDKSSFRHTA